MINTLSICLIAKNEEKHIERCIKSIINIADEIIVIDTGSTDNTIEIAKKLGASVYTFNWNKNFSEARNFALTHCTKDWIFMIDADEALEISHGTILKEFISSTSKEAIYLNVINVIGSEEININPSLRIFRNNQDYKYIYKLHEQVYNSIVEKSGENSFEYTNFIIKHYGYDHNVIDMTKKAKRNIEILDSYLEEEKDSLYYFNLGNEYSKLSELPKAKDYFEKSFDLNIPNGFKPYLALNLIKTCYTLKFYTSALKYLELFLEIFPDFRDLYFLQSSCYNEMMKYYESYIALTIYKSINPNVTKYPSFNFDKANNIDTLINSLYSLSIPHSYKLLSTLILVNKHTDVLFDVIKSANEISDEILVVNLTGDSTLNNEFLEYGCIVYDSSMADINFDHQKICENSTCTWTLYLNENRVLNHYDRKEILNTINECEKNNLKESFANFVLLKK